LILFHALWRGVKTALIFLYSLVEVTITRPRTRPERAAWLSVLCKRQLAAIDVHVFTHGEIPAQGAVISNHLSFVDILVQGSLQPCVFVSKADVRKLPVLGWMSMMAGTVYVERGAGGSAQQAAKTMSKAFRDALPIVFFPEGTTGDGEALAPFKSGLLAQTLEAQATVTPSFLRYEVAQRDLAAGLTPRFALYWREQTMLQLIWRLLKMHRLDVHVRFGEPVAFTPAAFADRKVAAVEAHRAMEKISAVPLM
jgi:1-acyl-sn-glycerol-3-phosphate acyltransferase